MKTLPDKKGLAYNTSIFCSIIAITIIFFVPVRIQELVFMLPLLGIIPIIVCMLSRQGSLSITLPDTRQTTRWYIPALMQLIFIGLFTLIDLIFQAVPTKQTVLPLLQAINHSHILTWIPAAMGIGVMSFILYSRHKRVGIGSIHTIDLQAHAKDTTLFSN